MQANAQIGAQVVKKMNALMKQYGAKNVSLLKYEPRYGLVHQNLTGYTDHYTIREIKKIVVLKAEEGATAQFLCDPAEACISHIGENGNSTYLPSANYYFFEEDAANRFAELAAQIIKTDFNIEVVLELTREKTKDLKAGQAVKKETAQSDDKDFLRVGIGGIEPKQVSPKKKPKKVKDYLSVDAYSEDAEQNDQQYLSAFGKKLITILQLAEQHKLDKIKGAQADNVSRSTIKLPKAKQNYLNDYKGADCFIAEFGTKKYYEDLQDLYYEIKDEIEASLPASYEGTDMAYETVYENSDDEVFHTEYYNIENLAMPSIVIRITPDGKGNTLFLRIGKR